ADVPLGEVQPGADNGKNTVALGEVQPGIAFGDMKSLRASDVVNADDASAARQKLAGGDAPVRQGTTVVEHAKGIPAPDLEKDAKDIRKATERDDWLDTGTDKKAIFKAMEGKTPEQTLELMKIYAKNNKGADLMQDLKEELG